MDAVNFQSLNLVRDELIATIEEGSSYLDSFADDDNIFAKLSPCVECVRQIVGTLKLIEFNGAELLARELLATVERASPDFKKPRYERWLTVTSTTFVVLTRYIEYVQETEKRFPMLLIPQINELRKFRGEPSLPEGYFFKVDLKRTPILPPVVEVKLDDNQYKARIRRIRYLYQIGLIGLIRDRPLENSITMMRRGLDRAYRLTGDKQPISLLWWLAGVALKVFYEQNMQVLETRKLLFARIERIIRQVEKNGTVALNAHPPRAIIKELVYVIAMSSSDRQEAQLVRDTYGLNAFTYTDREMERQRNFLQGPSLTTINTLIELLKAELGNAKEILEIASQTVPHEIDNLEGFVGSLKPVAETLLILGQNAASKTLKDLLEKASTWRDGQEIDVNKLDDVVNTILYVDSVIDTIASTSLSDEKLEKASEVAQSELIASGLLADAKRIAIAEMQASLTLVKTVLGDVTKSDMDKSRIQDIGEMLVKVGGALLLMNCHQASSIVSRGARFTEEVFIDQGPLPDMEEKLEAFADTIISVEYYLKSASRNLQMDESVLALAEESLKALGYPQAQG